MILASVHLIPDLATTTVFFKKSAPVLLDPSSGTSSSISRSLRRPRRWKPLNKGSSNAIFTVKNIASTTCHMAEKYSGVSCAENLSTPKIWRSFIFISVRRSQIIHHQQKIPITPALQKVLGPYDEGCSPTHCHFGNPWRGTLSS